MTRGSNIQAGFEAGSIAHRSPSYPQKTPARRPAFDLCLVACDTAALMFDYSQYQIHGKVLAFPARILSILLYVFRPCRCHRSTVRTKYSRLEIHRSNFWYSAGVIPRRFTSLRTVAFPSRNCFTMSMVALMPAAPSASKSGWDTIITLRGLPITTP